MTRLIAILLAGLSIAGAGRAYAQEAAPGPGTVEVTVIPGGGTFYTTGDQGPSFGNYNLGGALAYNVNRIFGIEGEVGGAIGVLQDLQFGGLTSNQKGPNQLNYSGNLVVSAPTRKAVVPYVTGGIGGLTMFKQASLGINGTDTFLTGDVGGGLKWYASNGRWGVRGDYRFIAVRANDTAPAFFGQETRYGHRVYGAVIINAVR
jgi:outer membrane protein with beta-barrel domain